MTTLEAALRQFDATEANLGKLEKLWEQIYSLIPEGPAFGSPPEYGELCLAVRQILPALPAIDGFRVTDQLHEYDAIGQMRLDALEVGEIESKVAVENAIEEQGRQLREYRFKFQTKRRHLVRDRLLALIDHADDLLRRLGQRDQERPANSTVGESAWDELKEAVAEIDTLIGSSSRPSRWSDLQRHLHFGMEQDLLDIQRLDWPSVKAGLREDLYGQHDPVPVDVADLGDMVASKPIGAVTTSLNWSVLSDEDFERLVFLLIADTPGYENPEWLQQTNAPDRGRDLSVVRVETDRLLGVKRHRTIVQCKHWLKKSVSATDVGSVRTQMELWEPPRVDNLIIATSGRFTADAVDLVEKHNRTNHALHISMWPDSHLERLLASRPHLIAQFGLRRG